MSEGVPNLSVAAVQAATERWLLEAVIGLNLCPFARAPQLQGRVRIVVSQAPHVDGFLDDLDAELLKLKDTSPEELETTLLVHPKLFSDFYVFNDFANVVDEIIDEHELSEVIEFVLFHPDLVFEGASEDSPENLPNRSPFPMLHLLRTESLERAVPEGDTSDILARNRETLKQWTAQDWRKRWSI